MKTVRGMIQNMQWPKIAVCGGGDVVTGLAGSENGNGDHATV